MSLAARGLAVALAIAAVSAQPLPPQCSSAVQWPAMFSTSQGVSSSANYTVCVVTPVLPQAVIDLISPFLGLASATFSDPGGPSSLAYSAATRGAPGCAGVVAVNATAPPCTAPLVPTTVADAGFGNYSLGLLVGGAAVAAGGAATTATLSVAITQACASGGPGSYVTRGLCVDVPAPGAVDYYMDPSSSFFGPTYVSVGGCSVDPTDCGGGAPGAPCCFPGWVQVAPLSGITSCGWNCYNCSGVCAPPSASGTPTSSPTASSTASTTATASPSRSVSGAGPRGGGAGLATAVAAAALLLTTTVTAAFPGRA
jgi:hypothetical protein